MSGTGRPVSTFQDWMRDSERRTGAQERRPAPRTAAALLGPGIAPTAVPVADWNDDVTSFNGMFYSQPGAANTPDSAHAWIGWSLADSNGSGIQRVQRYGADVGGSAMIRGFTSTYGSTRVFTAWTAE